MLPGRSDDPVVYAEQALLGALLQRPAHLATIADRLQTGDFYHPAHQALYQTLLDQHATGHPAIAAQATDADHTAWLDTTVSAAVAYARVVTPAYISRLIDYCPHPDHAPVYARMVLAGSIRRTIATHAQRLAHAARIDALANQGPTNTVDGVPHLAQAVRHATTRWGSTNPHPRPLPAPPGAAISPPTQQDDEATLLGALAQHPEAIPTITAWLHPEDLTNHTHQTLYRCMAALHHRGDPIDPVTLTWEAHHRDTLTPHLTTDDITRLTTPNGGDPHYWADRLLQTAFIRTAATTAHTIHTTATDPTVAPGALLTTATTGLSAIAHAHHRWRQAERDSTQPRAISQSARRKLTEPPRRNAPTESPEGSRGLRRQSLRH